MNIGGYDLSENDIIALSSFSYMGYTPEQCTQLFIKLKQNGKVTGKELLDLGIANEPNWFDRLTGNTPDNNASFINKMFQLGQEYSTSISELDYSQRQERFEEALGIVAFAGLNSGPNKGVNKIPEEEMRPYKYGDYHDYFWGGWADYKKVTIDGQEYAQVGNRLYTEHGVLRMQPSGARYKEPIRQPAYPGNNDNYGRSVAPRYVEYIIESAGKPVYQPVNDTFKYTYGSVDVILNRYGAVVSIVTH